MFRTILCGLGVLYAVTLVSSKYQDAVEEESVFSQYHDKFDTDLLRNMDSSEAENVVFSPFSLKMALSILYLASSGNTKVELEKILEFPKNVTVASNRLLATQQSLKTPASNVYILDIGSRMYLDKALSVTQQFGSKLEDFYQTEIKTIDSQSPQNTVKDANDWVRDVTHGNIKELLSEGDLADAVVLLLTTVYFKGTWDKQFYLNETYSASFFINSTKTVQATMMSQTEKFDFVKSKYFDSKILRMPYKGDKLSMLVILPNSINGLNDVIRKLNPTKLYNEINIMDNRNVKVSFPKFRFDYQSHFKPILQKMGINDIFEITASLPLLARGGGLQKKVSVSNVLQRAGIEVNELGSTAFAATEVTLVNKFGEDEEAETEEFIATKPFLFMIEDSTTKQILFMGKVGDPSILSDDPLPSSNTNAGNTQQNPIMEGVYDSSAAPQNNRPLNLSPQSFAPAPVVNTRFNFIDLELLKQTAELLTGNFMISPASVKSSLGMILEGAKGSCAEELRRNLRLSPNEKEAREQLTGFLSELQVRTPGITLASANKIFLSHKLTPKQDYVNLLNDAYFSELQLVDFSQAQNTAKEVNKWINTSTRGLIPTLVEPNNFAPDTVMLIANALYFKGLWENAFDEKMTSTKCFTNSGGCQNTPMMENQAEFNYGQITDLAAQAIELPYKGNRYSMLIILPVDKKGLNLLIKDLPAVPLHRILSQMEKTDVQVSMPRFTIDFSIDLVSVLRNVGIREVFSNAANLSGIVEGGVSNPQINNFFHKTRIEVNEQGSIAAAATGAMVVPLMSSTTDRMIIDHPFFFFIRDMTTGSVLFEGRVDEPDLATDNTYQTSLNTDELSIFENSGNNQPAVPYQGSRQPPTNQNRDGIQFEPVSNPATRTTPVAQSYLNRNPQPQQSVTTASRFNQPENVNNQQVRYQQPQAPTNSRPYANQRWSSNNDGYSQRSQ